MAVYENTRLLVDGARGSDLGISHGLSSLATYVTDLNHSLGVWNSTRKTRKVLSKLSDRELDDIGLIRGDITTFSAGSARH